MSWFHVKGELLSVCFPGRLKLFTMQEGFQATHVRACVSVSEAAHSG